MMSETGCAMVGRRDAWWAVGCWALAAGLVASAWGAGPRLSIRAPCCCAGCWCWRRAACLGGAGRAAGRGWTLEAVAAWALLGSLLVLVDPRAIGRGPALLIFFPALFGALASPALLWAARQARLGRPCGPRARRQGYLVAGALCGLLLLQALGALTAVNGLLCGLIVASAQGLLLTHGQATARARPGAADATTSLAVSGGDPATAPELAAPVAPLGVPLRPALARPVGRQP